jgi:hypothetical protein
MHFKKFCQTTNFVGWQFQNITAFMLQAAFPPWMPAIFYPETARVLITIPAARVGSKLIAEGLYQKNQ